MEARKWKYDRLICLHLLVNRSIFTTPCNEYVRHNYLMSLFIVFRCTWKAPRLCAKADLWNLVVLLRARPNNTFPEAED